MNRQFLGDALDWWKGGLLTWLRKDDYLRDVVVVPCFTDSKEWSKEDFALYSQLLGVDKSSIHDEGGASEYSDFFFDPDTGVKTGRVKKEAQYLTPNRLLSVLRGNPNCVAAVYQHVSRQSTHSRLNQVVEVLRQNDKKVCFCSLESSNVAMLFASRHCGRIESIHNGLTTLYRSKAPERVYLWTCVLE